MSTKFNIPMNEETRISLEDCFIDDDNMDARKFVYLQVTQCCQDAKRCLRANSTPVNRKQDGWKSMPPQEQYKQEDYKLNDTNLDDYNLESNNKWVPTSMEGQEVTPIELKLGDNTMKYLKNFGQLNIIRHEQFNLREKEQNELELSNIEAGNVDPRKLIETTKKNQEAMNKTNLDAVPTCLEQCVYNSIWPVIAQKIEEGDRKLFDKEYDDIYKKTEVPPTPAVEPTGK